jgi:hypothetical protein
MEISHIHLTLTLIDLKTWGALEFEGRNGCQK